MTDRNDITQSLTNYIQQTYGPFDQLATDTPLATLNLLESLTIMDLLAHIESTYNVSIPPENISPSNFRSINTLTTLINSCQSKVTT